MEQPWMKEQMCTLTITGLTVAEARAAVEAVGNGAVVWDGFGSAYPTGTAVANIKLEPKS